MEITLTGECEQFLREKVSSGSYSTAEEVIHKALRLMREQEQLRLEELRKEIAIGVNEADLGFTTEFNEATLEQIKENARARMRKSQ